MFDLNGIEEIVSRVDMPVSHRIHERHESEVGKGDRWHCLCCGYILSSSVQPQSCPECGHGKLVIIESGKPRKKK